MGNVNKSENKFLYFSRATKIPAFMIFMIVNPLPTGQNFG